MVSRGRSAFENAIKDPDSLIDVVEDHDGDCQFEDFFYLASSVWSEKTGLGIDEQPGSLSLDPGEPEGEGIPGVDPGALTTAAPEALGAAGLGSNTSVPPTVQALAAAHGATVPDLIRPGLKVLFCGINPSLYSAAVGHHFARPGNRFWPALHAGGFTPRRFSPWEGGGPSWPSATGSPTSSTAPPPRPTS